MKNKLEILIILISILFLSSNVHADPNVLLGEAIKNASKLKGSLPTKERLATYENIFLSLDKIVSDHPGSDQAIKLLSGQAIGNFDPSTLRNLYVKDLTGYYDKVCETSPSYSCLGFVSLKTGNDGCVAAKNFADISEAHFNLQNAGQIFIGQKSNKSFISLALDSYRRCLSRSKFSPTQFAKDFFASRLLELLLQAQQVSLAKATIENMETAYFKFRGVLELSAHGNKAFNKAFFDRLSKYIEAKIKDEDGARAMAQLALLLGAVERADFPISYQLAHKLSQDKSRGWGKYQNSCDYAVVSSAFNALTNLQYKLKTLKGERSKFTNQQLDIIIMGLAGEDPADEFTFDGDNSRMLISCRDNGYHNYWLMAVIHGQILNAGDPVLAAEFKKRALSEIFSEKQQIKFFLSNVIKTVDQLKGYENKYSPDRLKRNIFKRKDARYYVFEKMVDFGKVCDASNILFKELKGGSDYDRAIKYMIDSPNVNPSKKYECGDEELELLLK